MAGPMIRAVLNDVGFHVIDAHDPRQPSGPGKAGETTPRPASE
jgi:hypothetical protein